jgi:ribosomal protein L11 methylase PrmA
VRLNGLEDSISLHAARFPEQPERGPFGLILANVYYTFFQQQAGALADAVAPGGMLLASGLQHSEADLVTELLGKNGFSTAISAEDEGWILVEGLRE